MVEVQESTGLQNYWLKCTYITLDVKLTPVLFKLGLSRKKGVEKCHNNAAITPCWFICEKILWDSGSNSKNVAYKLWNLTQLRLFHTLKINILKVENESHCYFLQRKCLFIFIIALKALNKSSFLKTGNQLINYVNTSPARCWCTRRKH